MDFDDRCRPASCGTRAELSSAAEAGAAEDEDGTDPVFSFAALPAALRRALIVDGDPEYRRVLRGLLEPCGFEVEDAANGRDGLDTALAWRPWLILTEVNTSGLDGFELCRRVRGHALLRRTPLVFLSEWDGFDERYHGLRLGADDYVSKRLPARELLIRFHLVLRRHADAGPPARPGAGMEGSIEIVGVPDLLQMCHRGRFSGICTLDRGIRRVQVRFRGGQIVGAEHGSLRGAAAVYELLSWSRGHFSLASGDPGDGSPLPESFDMLMLEGCRRLDEGRRSA